MKKYWDIYLVSYIDKYLLYEIMDKVFGDSGKDRYFTMNRIFNFNIT